MPNCVFCKSEVTDSGEVTDHRGLWAYTCPICKKYFITVRLAEELAEQTSINTSLVNCISENILSNDTQHVHSVWAHQTQNFDNLELPERTSPKPYETYANQLSRHSEKPFKILALMRDKVSIKQAFDLISFSISDMYRLKIVDWDEFLTWINYLDDADLIFTDPQTNAMRGTMPFTSDRFVSQGRFAISVRGWQILEEKQAEGEHFAFIAQDFSIPNREAINQTISEACIEAVGFEARPVDQNPDENDYIPDKIFDSIIKSSTVIADLTNNNKGVYYEAGFAKGLGKKVILIINDQTEHTDHIHFDLKQYEQIRYSNTDDLKEKLVFKLRVLFPEE